MESFKLTLANGAIISGLHNIPPPSPSSPKYRPLLVGLHGASYSALYFDVDDTRTARLSSDGLGVPFVAINRPCYEDSTPFYPIPDGSSFPEQFGLWLHKFILPALWEEYGLSQGCNSIVLDCHSLGATGAIIAAALHAQDQDRGAGAYPLAGLIVSGFGTQPVEAEDRLTSDDVAADRTSLELIEMPSAAKDAAMFAPGTVDEAVLAQGERLNRPVPSEEIRSLRKVWLPRWRAEWGRRVRVPVMVAVAERDALWTGTEEHLGDFMGAFSGSERVDGSLVRGAPHCIELSWWSQGWYARCFGFAIECAASLGVAGE